MVTVNMLLDVRVKFISLYPKRTQCRVPCSIHGLFNPSISSGPYSGVNRFPRVTDLVDAIQLEPVASYLIINLIRLASDACNVRVLIINLLAHSAAELMEVLGHAVKLIC
jgi:hypothetical protein